MENGNPARVARNTGFMFVRMLVVTGVGLFTSREVLRVLGVDDFGIYNIVGSVVVMFAFLQAALNNATSRFITFELGVSGAGGGARLKQTFSMSLNVEFALAVVIVGLSEVVGLWFINHKLQIPAGRMEAAHVVFHLSLVNFALNIIRTPFNSLIIAHEHMDYFAFTSVIEALLKLVIVYLLLILCVDKLVLYALLQLGVSVVIFFWLVMYCAVRFRECRYIRHWDSGLLKKLTRYSGWSLIVNMVDLLVLQAISIFFNVFYGVVANAAYAIANQVNVHLNYFNANFTQSYNPQIIKSYAAKEYGYFMKLLYSASKLTFFLYFMVAFPVMINIRYLLRLWLVNPPQMTEVFLCLIIGYSLFDSFSAPLWQSVHATGNLRTHQILMGAIKVMNIPLSYALLKAGCPIYCVLVVFVALNAVCAIVRIIYLRWLIHLDTLDYVKKVVWQMLKIVIISIPIPLLIMYLCGDNRPMNLCLTSVSFYLLYIPGIYLLALNAKEKALAKGMIGKLVEKVRRK